LSRYCVFQSSFYAFNDGKEKLVATMLATMIAKEEAGLGLSGRADEKSSKRYLVIVSPLPLCHASQKSRGRANGAYPSRETQCKASSSDWGAFLLY
jgi:hypothetical protein